MHTQNQNERYDNVMNTWGGDVDCIFYSDDVLRAFMAEWSKAVRSGRILSWRGFESH